MNGYMVFGAEPPLLDWADASRGGDAPPVSSDGGELPESALVDTVGEAAFAIGLGSQPSGTIAQVRSDRAWKLAVTWPISPSDKSQWEDHVPPLLYLHSSCCCAGGDYELQTQEGSVHVGLK